MKKYYIISAKFRKETLEFYLETDNGQKTTGQDIHGFVCQISQTSGISPSEISWTPTPTTEAEYNNAAPENKFSIAAKTAKS